MKSEPYLSVRVMPPLILLWVVLVSIHWDGIAESESQGGTISKGQTSTVEKLKEDLKEATGKRSEGRIDDSAPTENQTSSPWFLQHQKVWEADQPTSNDNVSERKEEERSDVNKADTRYSWFYYSFRVVISLLFVVGLIFVVLGLMKYVSQQRIKGIKSLGKVIGVLPINSRVFLYYIHTSGKVLLISVAGEQVQLLHIFSEDEFFTSTEVEPIFDKEPDKKTFSRILDEVEARIHKRAEQGSGTESTALDEELAILKADVKKLHQLIREEKSES